MSNKKRNLRASFRKNREVRTRDKDFTQRFHQEVVDEDTDPRSERISGRGELTRKRTVAGAEVIEDASGTLILPEIDPCSSVLGRVLRVQGLVSYVSTEDKQILSCATRRLLKTLTTDQRHVIAAGDRVWVRRAGEGEGIIERIEPRHGVLSRTSRGRQHVLVANVDQILIVASAAEPRLKPNLLDRYLVTAERNAIEPVLCINKIDLVDPAALLPITGVYGQLGYRILLTSVVTGQGIARLAEQVRGRESVITGQSGVGKSSLLNLIDPDLNLPVRAVSSESQKGRHTTSTAELIPLAGGGYVVDTPGIRQFQLWDVIPEEVAGFFRELRPYVSSCRFPDCTHTHESHCRVKEAVSTGQIDARRYASYVQIQRGDSV
ncbi:MAG: ribosome small subunit-dependent GTPase A [Pirellulales bacterium]|nr:ribosome small subunit-dependent GTPase A [Pirellulales bacterium]